MYIVCEIMIGE